MTQDKNQYVRSSKWMLLIGLSLLILMLVLAPGGRHSNESKIVRARQTAEILGDKLAQIHNLGSALRGPASEESNSELPLHGEGLIGLDPWGQPYRYNVLNTDQGVARIVLMSDGPPRGSESQDDTNEEPTEPIRVVITSGE